MLNPATIPGMIEPAEQAMLTKLAEKVAGQGSIVEFGCFFGRSTACLVKGAQTWWTADQGPIVYAYDSFGCLDGNGFAQYVRSFAKQAGSDHLIRRDGKRIDFYPVFQNYLGEAEQSGLLSTTVAELSHSEAPAASIALIHVDAPKHYEELKYILYRFFPLAISGGVVVFQDYFYHWSASVIAAVQVMVERGLVRAEQSFASSLVVTLLRQPTLQDAVDIDLAMQTNAIPDLIDRAIAMVKTIEVDRREQFAPRVHLAKLQNLWEAGKTDLAEQELQRMIAAAGGLTKYVFADFRELMRHGFSIRQLYERDREG